MREGPGGSRLARKGKLFYDPGLANRVYVFTDRHGASLSLGRARRS